LIVLPNHSADFQLHALEKLPAEGRVRAIGVSNFLPEHLEKIIGRVGQYRQTLTPVNNNVLR
jgi:diketogulonate reductase-like aldo/keto reductase